MYDVFCSFSSSILNSTDAANQGPAPLTIDTTVPPRGQAAIVLSTRERPGLKLMIPVPPARPKRSFHVTTRPAVIQAASPAIRTQDLEELLAKPRIQGLSLLTSGSARPLLWSVVPKHKRRRDLLDYSRGAYPSPPPDANFLEFFLPVSYSLHVKIIHANFMHFAQRHLIRQISSSI